MLLLVVLVLLFASAACLHDRSSGPTVLLGVLLVTGLVVMILWFTHNDEECSAKGGTYLYREGKCIDVREIP